MAVVAQGDRQRLHLPPNPEHEQLVLNTPPPSDPPTGRLPDEVLGFRVQRYGMGEWADLFTNRQLTALCAFSSLVNEARQQVLADALAVINAVLDETLESSEADLDADTRWALTWHAQHGFEPGGYGQAEQLSKSRSTSVEGLVTAGIAASHAGKVRLLGRDELDEHWDPAGDDRLTAWEAVNHLARTLETGGEQPADALACNSLVQAWPELTRLAHKPPEGQTILGLT